MGKIGMKKIVNQLRYFFPTRSDSRPQFGQTVVRTGAEESLETIARVPKSRIKPRRLRGEKWRTNADGNAMGKGLPVMPRAADSRAGARHGCDRRPGVPGLLRSGVRLHLSSGESIRPSAAARCAGQ